MTTPDTRMLVDEACQPVAIINLDTITDHGTKLAFRTAASCNDPDRLAKVAEEMLAAVGLAAFGYVCAALRILAEHILNPALTAGEAAGVHLRGGPRRDRRRHKTPSADRS